MIIVITGGTGLVGQKLIHKLLKKNYKIHLLNRKAIPSSLSSCQSFLWPDVKAPIPQEAFPKEESYGVIHLAGESISQWPWTKQKKEKIYSSRIKGTQNLVSTLKKLPKAPEFFLSASATGIYAEQGEKQLTEAHPIQDQKLFLQKVCKDWEEEALKISSLCRTLIFRFGIVMSYKKGFLYEQMKWLKKSLLPLIIHKNPIWLSWISLEDLSSMILWAIENKQSQGIYNASSPKAVSLNEFYKILLKQNKRKSIKIPSPLFLMKLVGGEMFKNLLVSCKAFPAKALEEAFVFKQENLEEALKK